MNTTSPTPSQKIHDLNSLEREISRLRRQARGMEQELDNNFDHLHDNFHRMAWNSLIRYNSHKQSWSAGVVQGILGQERVQRGLGRLVNFLADLAAEGLDNLINRLFGRKR